LVTEMYARGLSTRDVEDAFRDATGEVLLSKSAVSEITDRLWEDYPGQHLTGLMRAVAHHQPAAVLVALADELGEVGVDLGLQGLGQHPTSTVTDNLVDQ
jgi:hypothetical protein